MSLVQILAANAALQIVDEDMGVALTRRERARRSSPDVMSLVREPA